MDGRGEDWVLIENEDENGIANVADFLREEIWWARR